MTDSISCPSCRSVDTFVVGPIPAAQSFAGITVNNDIGGGDLMSCRTCTIRYRFPQLSKSELDVLYTSAGGEVWQGLADSRVDWQIAASFISRGEVRSILDVGCFDGRFLSGLNQGLDLYGIEINSAATQTATRLGVKILGNDFAALNSNHSRFDVITAFDVIEHVSSPREFLASCSNALRPGGALLLATGNAESWPWKLLGSRHQYCICAEHISFISPRWCEAEAPIAGLRLDVTRAYRRGKFSIGQRLRDIAVNMLFAGIPGSISWLRGIGFGNPDVKPSKDHPPLWPSAADHFFARFEKL